MKRNDQKIATTGIKSCAIPETQLQALKGGAFPWIENDNP